MKFTVFHQNKSYEQQGKISILFSFLIPFFIILFLASLAYADPLKNSLVKIFTTVQNPNYYEPWRVDSQTSVSGSGCVISGHRILTNAHVVSNQIFIQVLKEGDTKKYTAVKEFVAHDCDLAILKVEDSKFFKGTKAVTFGGMPSLKDKVQVYGYPIGGEELSITEGVVSRIEVIPYSHSWKYLLGVQTNAAINPGNSGGPVFNNKKMIGVAFQGYNSTVAQNTGFFIPIPIINRFLGEIKKGHYQNIPTLGVLTEPLENDYLRSYLKMKPSQSGVLVTEVNYQSSSWNKLQKNDVILSIDGHLVANDSTISFSKGERIYFGYPLELHHIGDKTKIKILRQGKQQTVTVTLKDRVQLVPTFKYDINPTYFIFDGLVFTPLNFNYMQAIQNPPPPQFSDLINEGPSESRKQVVLLSHILTNEINKGYDSNYSNSIVCKVNGIPISDMKDLVEAFKKPLEGRHVVEVENPEYVKNKIILDAENSNKASAEILNQNNISGDRSLDLK